MPTLPSGLTLGISREALFDPGVNWFSCPENHFWYWTPDPETGLGPFPSGHEIVQIPKHAAVPASTEEAKQYVRVIVFDSDTTFYWPGEWLSPFPALITLDDLDLAAWQAWLGEPERVKFLEDTIAKCQELAISSRCAQGYAIFAGTGDRAVDGSLPGTWNPDQRWP
jgi:hypothetical protein